MAVDYGKVWGAVRAGLTMERERLVEAFAAPSHDYEAAALDDISRDITDRIERTLTGHVSAK